MSRRQWKRLDALERTMRGELTMDEAAQVLGLSKRQVRRLRRRVETEGAGAVLHRNTGRHPANRIVDEIRQQVVEMMRSRYVGFNDQHFTEKLASEEGIALSRQTVRRILRAADIPAARRRRPRRYRGRRKRKPQAGLMLLWDGSLHDWLEGRGPPMCLMGAMDDATGELLPGAHFVERECAAGYLRVLLVACQEKGLAWSIYMDRHGSLKRNDKHWTLEEELRGEQDRTQVGRALEELDIEPIYALSPEAKGRIERMWGTLQDRLVSELRLAGACTIDEANVVLEAYRPQQNQRFACAPEDCNPAWRKPPRGTDLERVCSFVHTPKVGNDNTVVFEGTLIQIPPPPGRTSFAGKRVELRHLLNGEMRVYLGAELLAKVQAAKPTHAAQRRKRTSTPRKQQRKATHTFREIVARVRTAKAKPRGKAAA